MANFNENAKCVIGYILNSQEFFIYRTGTIKEFARMIHDELYLLTNTYRLFIQYKTTHRAKKMAGRCFLWDNSHGDHIADPGNGIELRSINDASQDDCEGFCRPRFDGVSSAILIADSYVFAYGDVQIEADDIVLMDDDPVKIATAMNISRKTLRIVHQNIVFALAVKIACLALGAVGFVNMWWAIFADVGVMIIAVLNAMRALKYK